MPAFSLHSHSPDGASTYLRRQHQLEAYSSFVVLLAVWLSGNVLASINVVALRQTQLVSGWVPSVDG